MLRGSERDVRRLTREFITTDAETEPKRSKSGSRSSSKPSDWGAPEPILAATQARPYPSEELPDLVRQAVREVAGFSQAPTALVGCSALSARSLAGQHLCTVQRAAGLEGPAGLYVMVIAESGERKSAVDDRFTAPIRAFEREAAERAKPDLAAYRAGQRAWEAKVRGVESKLAASARTGKSTAADEETLRGLEESKPCPPRIPSLLYADATPEALAVGLAERWPSVGILSAEAGSVLGGHGMGRDSILRSLALLNSAWDGWLAPSARVSRGTIGPRAVRVTCGLAAQPEAVRAFIESSRKLARGTGFLARFLVAWPDSTQGTRFFKEPPREWPALSALHERLTCLLEIPARFENGDLAPDLLRFSPPARRRWADFHDDVECELGPAGMLADARDFAAKAADNAARMAALFHLLDHGPGGTIGLDAIEAAAPLVNWHVLEARRFTGQLAISQDTADALKLDGWLISRCSELGVSAIEKRETLQRGPNAVRIEKALTDAVRLLARANRARFAKNASRQMIEVNPALLGGGA